MSQPWIFMGIDRSHFSAKLRPAIRYKKIHCVEYPPDPKEIQKRTGIGFIPILISPEDETFQDSTDIIDVLETRFPEPALIPHNPVDLALCRLFELYADEFFPMVSMRTRWAFDDNEQEMRRAFAAFSGSTDRGNAVADLMSSYLPMLGVTQTTIPVIDAHAEDMLATLSRHLSDHPFLLGERMSLADCALMGPLYAHLYLDRVTRRQLYDTALEVCMWIERCNRPVPEAMGDWFEGDYPATLNAILDLIGQDAVPMLTDQCRGFCTWAETSETDEELPRGVGTYQTRLRNIPVEAGIRSYVSWKVQRLQDVFTNSSPDEQSRISKVFTRNHCDGILSLAEIPRLTKKKFQLVFE